MPLLNDAEIVQMRAVAEEALDGTAVIQSRTYSSDGGGGGTTVWTASGTVDCAIAPILSLGEDERITGSKITAGSDWIITLPAETTVSTESRVVVSERTFEVTALRAPRTWELTRRVEATEVQ